VAQCRSDLRALDGARIFLTGGTGFLGRWLVATWARAQAHGLLRGQLTVLTRRPPAEPAGVPGLVYHAGDQDRFDLPEGAWDFVLHGAVEPGPPTVAMTRNLRGFQRVLDLARAGAAGRFLLLSSGAVYGVQPPDLERVPETCTGAPDPMDPRQAYGEMKRAAELLGCAAAAEGGPAFVSARGFAFLGPGLPLDLTYAAGNFIRDALGEGPIVIQGDGRPFRSYLYAGDAAAWIWSMLVRGVSGRAYNLGCPDPVSILDLARTVRDQLCPGREVQVLGQAGSGLPPRYVPDTARAEGELGLRSTVALSEAIRRTAAWSRREGRP
jgi:dTDP-glucose 4,6-dehydratase